MREQTIPYQQIGAFSAIVQEYLSHQPALAPFYNYPTEITSFEKAMHQKSLETIDRNALVAALHHQYKNIAISELTKNQIDALANENTFCVVTAHQLNIFTGPLYVIYKTLSAIALCAQLKSAYPDRHFVPVFWLGSEDHDFTEINHIHLFGKTFTWEDEQGGACGRYHPESLKTILDALSPVLGENANARELHALFEKAYLEHSALSDATRYILNALFGAMGLVVVDGDDVVLKAACSTIIEDELFSRSSEAIVNSTIAQLPHEAQAKPRQINLFYLQKGKRDRIVWEEASGTFSVLNSDIRFTEAEMRYVLHENIGSFSPNVILRPLFQQKVLPSLAYIGGGGELAYWLQLKTLFEHHHIDFPVLLLRNSFLLIDEGSEKKMQKTGIETTDIFLEENALIQQYVKKHATGISDLQAEKQAISALLDALTERVLTVDATLDKVVQGEKQNMLNALQKLEARIMKAEKNKMEVELTQIRNLKNKLFPLGGLQERHDNFIPYYLKYGPDFFHMLLACCRQPDHTFSVLFL